MRIWAEIWSADGSTRDGLVDLASCSVTRKLDAIANIKMTVPSSEPRNSILGKRKQAFVYLEVDERYTLIAQFILMTQTQSVQAGQVLTTWEGFDLLEELRAKQTWLGLTFEAEPFEDVVRELLPSDWYARVDAGLGNYSDRFDGVSKWKALLSAATKKGVHLRLGSTPRQVEIGVFGADANLQLVAPSRVSRGMLGNPNLALIQSLDIKEDTSEMFNKLVPLAGNGSEQALTLKRCSLSSPYSVQNEVQNGRTHYFIQDATSIAAYGQIERVITMPNTVPVSPTSAGRRNAANLLYEWGSAMLTRYKDPLVTYKVGVKKLDKVVLPGDKVHLFYVGQAIHNGNPVNYITVDRDVWVMGVTENYTIQGKTANFELSSIDLPAKDAVTAIVNGLTEVKDNQKAIALRTQAHRWVDSVTLDTSTPATYQFSFSPEAYELTRGRLTVRRANTDQPDSITVTVDGLAISTSIDNVGTPFLGGTAYLEVTLDIEEQVSNELLSGVNFEDTHTIEISCLYQSGTLELEFDFIECVGTIKV